MPAVGRLWPSDFDDVDAGVDVDVDVDAGVANLDVELQFSAAVAKVMAAMMVLLSELKKTSAEKSQSQCIPKGLQ